jgi:arylsulfatase A-like enzyme
MLVADALRADKLPMYADSRVRTPNIAKAAQAAGVTFTSTQAASPSSPPSHASIQSGCMPRVNGILGDKSKVNPGTPMVSAILAKAGIATDFVGDASFAMNRLKPVSTWNEFHMPNAEGKGRRLLGRGQTDPRLRRQASGQALLRLGRGLRGPHALHLSPGHDRALLRRPHGSRHRHPPRRNHPDRHRGRQVEDDAERWGQLKGLYDGEVEHLDECFGALTEG